MVEKFKKIVFSIFGEKYVRILQIYFKSLSQNFKLQKLDKNHFFILNPLFNNSPLNKVILRNLPSSDWFVYNQIVLEREYLPILKILKEKYKSDRPISIIDAGANIGLTTFYFKTFFPNSNILLIEPDQSNIDIINRNIATNKISNFEILKGGLWSKDTNLELVHKEKEWSTQVIENKFGNISAFSVNSIIDIFFNNEIIDFLKMDIEGSEKEIFNNGNLDFLNFIKIIAIEVHQSHISFNEVDNRLKEYGFITFLSGELIVGYK